MKAIENVIKTVNTKSTPLLHSSFPFLILSLNGSQPLQL